MPSGDRRREDAFAGQQGEPAGGLWWQGLPDRGLDTQPGAGPGSLRRTLTTRAAHAGPEGGQRAGRVKIRAGGRPGSSVEDTCKNIERPGVWTEMRDLNIYRTSYKDKKTTSVKKNLVYQMIYQGFMMVTPFLTVPYLAEVFGPGNIGQVSFVNNIVNYFVMFIALGVGTYGNREIAYIRNDKEKTAHTFIDIFFVHFLWGTVVLAGYILFCLITEKNRILYMISCISVLSAILDTAGFMRGWKPFVLPYGGMF